MDIKRYFVDQLKGVTARMTEGQHHLNCLTEAFSALLSVTAESEVDRIRASVSEAKLNYDSLSNSLSKNLLTLQEVYQRSEELRSNLKSVAKWLEDIKLILQGGNSIDRGQFMGLFLFQLSCQNSGNYH